MADSSLMLAKEVRELALQEGAILFGRRYGSILCPARICPSAARGASKSSAMGAASGSAL